MIGIRIMLPWVLAIAITAIVIIGFLNFDLMLEIWVRAIIAVLFIGVFFTLTTIFFRRN